MSIYGRFDLIYVKTDRNGTKYYHDINCPRCAGYGRCEKWAYTGRVCYECGGAGKRTHPKTIKIYTPEYEAKLDARRQAKAAKEAAEKAKYEEEHAEEIAAKKTEEDRRIFELRCANNGCGKDGVGYVLTGKTFSVKDQIKKAGGKWIYGVWICPVMIEGEGINAKKIDISSHVSTGMFAWKDDFDLYEEIFG